MKNAFDEWKIFRGFDTTKSIIDLSKDEYSIKDFGFLLSFCKLQKRMAHCIHQASNFYIFGCFQFDCSVCFFTFVSGFRLLWNFFRHSNYVRVSICFLFFLDLFSIFAVFVFEKSSRVFST